MMTLDIDGTDLQAWIDELAEFSEASAPAVTRVLFSDVDLRARAWVRRRCEAEGLASATTPQGTSSRDGVATTMKRPP